MNKLFAILIMCSLSLPVFAVAEQEVEQAQQSPEKLEVISTEELDRINNTVSEHDVLDIPEELPNSFKKPVGTKQLVKKFVIAMLCVVGTSVLLYVTLSLYNKVREGILSQDITPPEGEKPLDTPCDLTDAVKTFIDKTHWDGL